MKVDSLTPMLRTWDLPGTIEFYTRVLGFECKAQERVTAPTARHKIARGKSRLVGTSPLDQYPEMRRSPERA
jgi:hypothetical protein